MFLQTSIIQLFILLFHLPQSSSNAYYPEYNITDCEDSLDTYTKYSHYHENLKLLLHSLSISTPATGYFQHKQASSDGSSEVFGHALCRGDLQLPHGCSPCLEYAVSEIGKLCPKNNNAAVFYEHCFLRYSNENFFGDPTGTERFVNFSAEIPKDYQKEFVTAREKLFEKLLIDATDDTKLPLFYAAGEEVVSSDTSVYGLLQCTRDLSKEDCHSSLKAEIDKIPNYGAYRVALILLGKSSFLIYQNKPFIEGSNTPPEISNGDSKGKVIGIVVGVGLFILAMMLLLWFRRMKNKRRRLIERNILNEVGSSHRRPDDGIKIKGIEHLSLKFLDLERATNHFSNENIIGRGGSGNVYKGILNGQEIAVKRFSDKDSLQAAKQLEKEVTLLAGLHHVNLVRLIGYCIDENEMLLVYEYMANGSLEKHLLDTNSSKKVLNWNVRLSIIDGIIKGILYLHEDSQPKIFHRDLKPENILLDLNLAPKITDFGISKSCHVNQTHGNSLGTRIIGTRGYMAPEYLLSGQFTSKSDIYSLGVMLLEILTGNRLSRYNNSEIRNLRSYMSTSWKDATLSEKLAKIDCDPYSAAQEKILANILYIALLCVDNDPELRPKISEVRDFIKLSSNASFKTSDISSTSESSIQIEGRTDDSNLLPSLTTETINAMRSMPSIEISREMTNDVLR